MSTWMKAFALAGALVTVLLLFPATSPFRAGRVPAALGQAVPTHSMMDDAAGGFVVPPGQEKLLGEMLGLGATLPGQCQFIDGDANGRIIQATYTCGESQIVFELLHPSAAPAAAPHTAQFALVVRSGTPPTGLADAVLALLRAREAEFHWVEIQPPVKPAQAGPWLVVAGFVGLAVLGWAVWRRRSARRAPT